jgi:hypothetical protein
VELRVERRDMWIGGRVHDSVMTNIHMHRLLVNPQLCKVACANTPRAERYAASDQLGVWPQHGTVSDGSRSVAISADVSGPDSTAQICNFVNLPEYQALPSHIDQTRICFRTFVGWCRSCSPFSLCGTVRALRAMGLTKSTLVLHQERLAKPVLAV